MEVLEGRFVADEWTPTFYLILVNQIARVRWWWCPFINYKATENSTSRKENQKSNGTFNEHVIIYDHLYI